MPEAIPDKPDIKAPYVPAKPKGEFNEPPKNPLNFNTGNINKNPRENSSSGLVREALVPSQREKNNPLSKRKGPIGQAYDRIKAARLAEAAEREKEYLRQKYTRLAEKEAAKREREEEHFRIKRAQGDKSRM